MALSPGIHERSYGSETVVDRSGFYAFAIDWELEAEEFEQIVKLCRRPNE
jgi:hypothetical protein